MTDSRGIYNESATWALDQEESQLGRAWLGYGSLAAPYWFVGLEPGGEYDRMARNVYRRVRDAEADAATSVFEAPAAYRHNPAV